MKFFIAAILFLINVKGFAQLDYHEKKFISDFFWGIPVNANYQPVFNGIQTDRYYFQKESIGTSFSGESIYVNYTNNPKFGDYIFNKEADRSSPYIFYIGFKDGKSTHRSVTIPIMNEDHLKMMIGLVVNASAQVYYYHNDLVNTERFVFYCKSLDNFCTLTVSNSIYRGPQMEFCFFEDQEMHGNRYFESPARLVTQFKNVKRIK